MPEETEAKDKDRSGELEGKRTFVTLADITTFDGDRDIRERYLERYDAWIRYKRRVSLSYLLGLQRRYMRGRKRDMDGYMLAVLQEVMIEPKVVTEQEAQALAQGDGALLVSIVGEVVGDIGNLQEETAEEAGES